MGLLSAPPRPDESDATTPATSSTACPLASRTPDERLLPAVPNLTGALDLTELSETVEDLAPLPAGLNASPATLSEPNWANDELNWALYDPYWSPGASGATLASGPALSGALFFQTEPLEAAATATVPGVQSEGYYDGGRAARARNRHDRRERAAAARALYASSSTAPPSATAAPLTLL